MLTEEELRAVIVVRWHVAAESCRDLHRSVVFGQIKALVFVLTGKAVVIDLDTSPESILELCGIPFTVRADGNGVDISDEWCQAHELDGHLKHRRLQMFGW